MPMEKVKPGVAYTKSGKKKISGSADTTPTRQETQQIKQQRPSSNPEMARSLKPKERSKFEDQSRVDSTYRWK
jgi:hypothetical protein